MQSAGFAEHCLYMAAAELADTMVSVFIIQFLVQSTVCHPSCKDCDGTILQSAEFAEYGLSYYSSNSRTSCLVLPILW